MALEHRVLDDIRNFFNNDFVVNLADLQKPTYIFVRDFYARALIEFEVDTDNVRKASHLIEGMDNTVEITGDLNLVSAINKTFNFLQFGLFDLLSPGENNKRTVSMIASVMEFLNMADDLTSRLDFETYRNSKEQLNYMAEQAEAMRQKLTEIALSKDRVVQTKISLENELAKTKMKEQELCSEATAPVKEANATKIKLEEMREILQAKKAEVDKLKCSISCLKDELVGVQSLDRKEEERNRIEQEKVELHNKYLEKVADEKKYATALETIQRFSAVTDGVSGLFDEIGDRQEALLSIQKENADLKQTQSNKKEELSWLDNEDVVLENKIEQIKSNKMSIKKELKNSIGDQTKKSSKLVESVRKTKEEVEISDEHLDAIKKEADRAKEMFLEYFRQLKLNKLWTV